MSWEIIQNKPVVGVGLGEFHTSYMKEQAHLLQQTEYKNNVASAGDMFQANNQYLQYFAETGIIGITLFILMIFFSLRVGLKAILEDIKNTALIKAALISLIFLLVHMMFDSLLNNLPALMIFLFSLPVLSEHSNKYYFILGNTKTDQRICRPGLSGLFKLRMNSLSE